MGVWCASLVPLVFGLSAWTAPQKAQVRAPSLWSQSGASLTVPVPRGVRIVAADPPANWQSSSYYVRLAAATGRGGPIPFRLEVLQYMGGRAIRKGMLTGARFWTARGRLAWLSTTVAGWRGRVDFNWYYAFPIKGNETVTIIRFMCTDKYRSTLGPIVRKMARGVRFGPPRSTRRQRPQPSEGTRARAPK